MVRAETDTVAVGVICQIRLVSYLWDRTLIEVNMLCTLQAPNLTFPSANVPYGASTLRKRGLPLLISEPLWRRLSPFSHCHSLAAFQYLVWCSSRPFLFLNAKSTAFENSLALKYMQKIFWTVWVLGFLCSASSAEGKAGLAGFGSARSSEAKGNKQRGSWNSCLELVCEWSSYSVFCLFVRLYLGNA